MVSALISIIYSGYKVYTSALGQKTTFAIFRRNLVSIIAYVICNMYIFASTAFLMFYGKDFDAETEVFTNIPEPAPWYILIFKVLFVTQGVTLSLIRFTEPAVINMLKTKIK